MYKQIKTSESIQMETSGSIVTPIATLEDSSGGVCQIIIDDHCYVICLKQSNGTYKPTTHIFREVFDVLVALPSPN